jgi:hypothetical protein
VADLRAALAGRDHDPEAERLVADLREASTEFRAYWDDMQVAPLSIVRKLIVHPLAGNLDVQCDYVRSTGTGQRLIVFRPQPGTDTADSFDFLRVLGERPAGHTYVA